MVFVVAAGLLDQQHLIGGILYWVGIIVAVIWVMEVLAMVLAWIVWRRRS
jgi:hypothetical protein